MKRSYLVLLLVTLACAAGLTLLARNPRRAGRPSAAVAPVPEIRLALEFGEGAMTPQDASVPKGHQVRLSVTNRGGRPVTIALSGYEDRLAIGALAPRATWTGTLLADRPGEDFAWLVDGTPVGRFRVLGSHLEEGHR